MELVTGLNFTICTQIYTPLVSNRFTFCVASVWVNFPSLLKGKKMCLIYMASWEARFCWTQTKILQKDSALIPFAIY